MGDNFWEYFQNDMEDEDDKQDFMQATGKSGEIDEENYEAWMEWMGTDWIGSQLDEYIWALKECGELNEGFINNVSQGVQSFFGKGSAGANSEKNKDLRSQNGGLNLGKRWNAAKTNYQMTKESGQINDVIQFLENMVAKKQLSPQTTIADLIGGALNGNKYGRLHGMRDNRTSRASKAMNDIYRK